MSDFSLTQRELSPGSEEIRICGEFDRAVASRLAAAIERAAGCERLRIDLSECEFMDTAGVALLVEAQREMDGREQRLEVAGPRGQVERILTLTGVVPEPVQLSRRS